MKPGESLQTTPVLPSDATNWRSVAIVSGLVVRACTISTSGITGAGLKKWSPAKRSGRFVAAAISTMARLEVFEAKIVVAGQRPSRVPNTASFGASSSTTASMTRSQSLRSSSAVVPRIRPRAALAASSVSLPDFTTRASDESTRPNPFSRSASLTSRITVSYPACAHTCAIPEPMSPKPTTPTRLIVMDVPSRGSGSHHRDAKRQGSSVWMSTPPGRSSRRS